MEVKVWMEPCRIYVQAGQWVGNWRHVGEYAEHILSLVLSALVRGVLVLKLPQVSSGLTPEQEQVECEAVMNRRAPDMVVFLPEEAWKQACIEAAKAIMRGGCNVDAAIWDSASLALLDARGPAF